MPPPGRDKQLAVVGRVAEVICEAAADPTMATRMWWVVGRSIGQSQQAVIRKPQRARSIGDSSDDIVLCHSDLSHRQGLTWGASD
jgi:hypothetical protein